MTVSSRIVILLSLAMLVTGLAAGPAAAADPVLLGETPITYGVGGCGTACTYFQTGVQTGARTYTVPSQGVLTLSGFWVSSYQTAEEWVQARLLQPAAGSQAKVVGEGEKHSIEGLSQGLHTFLERVPAASGDLLGARFKTNNFIEATPRAFSTGFAADAFGEAASPANPSLGETFSTSSFTTARVNVTAVLEADEDGDGYGDYSQDLCPGSPVATSACSGTLFGSDLQGARTIIGDCSTYDCLRVQKTIDGSSTAAPYDGVVVRWRVLNASPGSYAVRVVKPNGAGTYEVLGSDTETVTSTASALFSHISSYQTRLPIPAGGYVGLLAPRPSNEGFQSGGSSTYGVSNDNGAEGSTILETGTGAGAVLYDADIEPDADHDGYGDVTQDECPTDASTQGPCPSSAGGGESSGTTQPSGSGTASKAAGATHGGSAKKPRITAFRAVPKRIRIGAATKLALSLTSAATVDFTTQRKASCGPHAKRCRRWTSLYTFKRSLPAGMSRVTDPGRYVKHGARRSLAAGAYRLLAVAKGGGATSPPVLASLTVVR